MAGGYESSDNYAGPRPKPSGIWIWMAGVIALMFVAVWMLSGEVHKAF